MSLISVFVSTIIWTKQDNISHVAQIKIVIFYTHIM